ncbi:MAG: alanine racemase [Lentisphaeria bacterium]|nr:alanine racemase [Lentisphaeria bacterium]
MMATTEARVTLDIRLGTIRENYRVIAEAVAPLGVMAVLKADAYGLGVQPIAACLKEAGVSWFGVAELREALAIVSLGLPVQILGGVLAEEIPEAVSRGVILPVTDVGTARRISAAAARQGRTAEVHYLIDTGMGRLGIRSEQAEEVIAATVGLPGLRASGIYSHFPHAYGDYDFSCHQVHAFLQLVDRLAQRGITFQHLHMANSDGVHNIDLSRRRPFTMVRTGINLYGCFDMEGRRTLPLREALTLRSRLVAVRDLPWGVSLGYGRTCILDAPTRVGTVAIGYADGLPLAMSGGRGRVMIRGCACPILGRISMDYTTVSLAACPEAQPGDEVICLGDGISVAEWAAAKGTITYEIICSFGNRVQRRYSDA